jgi:hypothetical protein
MFSLRAKNIVEVPIYGKRKKNQQNTTPKKDDSKKQSPKSPCVNENGTCDDCKLREEGHC